mmetsp:Transcript_11846/g.33366  ORF Transcript_11846/g.33366 Transcript_11846/m.33366 type:complete len:204 (+) Transcript_11846:718-1329(+)
MPLRSYHVTHGFQSHSWPFAVAVPVALDNSQLRDLIATDLRVWARPVLNTTGVAVELHLHEGGATAVVHTDLAVDTAQAHQTWRRIACPEAENRLPLERVGIRDVDRSSADLCGARNQAFNAHIPTVRVKPETRRSPNVDSPILWPLLAPVVGSTSRPRSRSASVNHGFGCRHLGGLNRASPRQQDHCFRREPRLQRNLPAVR